MLSPQLHLRRIPRSIRHPSSNKPLHTSNPRLFTSNSSFLFKSPANRPQLPFLHTPSASGNPTLTGRVLSVVTFSRHVKRLISTERRKKWGHNLKVGAALSAIVLLLCIAQKGLYQETIEQMYPTPSEWSWMSRWYLRSAKALQAPEKSHETIIWWSVVGSHYRQLLLLLEDPKRDGKGLKEQIVNSGQGESILIDGVGRAGYDIESMSEPWKKGYFECLMGAAETAEKLEGWYRDPVSRVSYPPEYVASPSNPRPKPSPKGATPLAENCTPAFESPTVFYTKILTTKGFQTNQMLDAALAYADWLNYKGLQDTAGEVYHWAMDIATEGLAVQPQKVVDTKTGVLKNDNTQYITENLLRTSKAMGVHHARTGDLASALAVFLSVLKARRAAPQSVDTTHTNNNLNRNDLVNTIDSKANGILTTIFLMFFPSPYPLPVRTGNEPLTRSQTTACEEAGLMAYIGEIIFASSSKESGLAWTRDAVDHAEIALLQLDEAQERKRLAASPSYGMQYLSPQEQCQDCLRSGLKNWKQMVHSLVVKAEKEELETMDRKSEYWFGRGQRKVAEKQALRRRWEAEEMILDDRSHRIHKLIGDEGVSSLTTSDSVFFG